MAKKKKGSAKRTKGRTASGRIRRGYRLTKSGRVVKKTSKRSKRK